MQDLSPIEYSPYLSRLTQTEFYIKREDMIPFGGGGNKARIVKKLLAMVKNHRADVIVTAGSTYSNFNRALALMAIPEGIRVQIVLINSETSLDRESSNKRIGDMMGVEFFSANPDEVKETIQNRLHALQSKGLNPIYIYGGGQTLQGCQAYMEVAEEISSQTDANFDLIATTLATGTTFSGLLIGGKSHLKSSKILGVSIAREKNQVMQTVQSNIDSSPLTDKEKDELLSALPEHILDNYIAGGYGKTTQELLQFIESTMRKTGIILDPVYTGKGLFGLVDYLRMHSGQYQNQRILFLYTGGFFNF